MKLLVPLPFDIAHLEHGRNLRVVHLLRSLSRHLEITCLVADSAIAKAASSLLPDLRIQQPEAVFSFASHDRIVTSQGVRRAVEYFGCDDRLLSMVIHQAPEHDAVLGFDLPSLIYVIAAGQANPDLRTVCDLIDDPWLTWCNGTLTERFSVSGLKSALAIRLMRRQLLNRCAALTAVAPRDAWSLSRAAGKPVLVVPNGVEIDECPPPAERKPLVVFTGAMNFAPNERAAVWLACTIWPLIHRKCPQAELAIVGAEPTARVQSLQQLAGVTVTGRVPDLREWLQQARVATAPMNSGCGMKNKVLEACAAGCPVVSTPLGAAGLSTGSEQGILTARCGKTFAEVVIHLLNDPDKAAAIGARGRKMVHQMFSWTVAAEKMHTVLTNGRAAGEAHEQAAPTEECPADPSFHEEALIHAAS